MVLTHLCINAKWVGSVDLWLSRADLVDLLLLGFCYAKANYYSACHRAYARRRLRRTFYDERFTTKVRRYR